ncbi:mycothiol synthase [Rathayibacter soli]|uniref:mycothiol synthase n=1 Tax=Rathayibacter soli TaxID=3144168 RepID=UPI0027E43C4C|nr:mycothiol synthase [Glaciibacter superstes]
MSDSLRLSVTDLTDAAAAADFFRVADAAREEDGYDPFNEQSRFDVTSGRRTPIVATVWSAQEHARAIGAAILGHGQLDFVIDPVFRGKGLGGIALNGLLATVTGELTAWAHGDHPAARILAERHGFDAVRRLLQLRAPLDARPELVARPGALHGGAAHPAITAFRPGIDDAEWMALNAAVFATHPEQGAVTLADLGERMAEPWFNAGDFLIARDQAGRMVGYNWLKIEPDAQEGEIYVIGVAAASAGQGLGRSLMRAGLARLRERGSTAATLYVEADNAAAVHLYRSLGFLDHTVDVQYRRIPR